MSNQGSDKTQNQPGKNPSQGGQQDQGGREGQGQQQGQRDTGGGQQTGGNQDRNKSPGQSGGDQSKKEI